jgi:hypothetical protein
MNDFALKPGMYPGIPFERAARGYVVLETHGKIDDSRGNNPPVSNAVACFPVPERCFHKGKITGVEKLDFTDIPRVTKHEAHDSHDADIRYELRYRKIAEWPGHAADIKLFKRPRE